MGHRNESMNAPDVLFGDSTSTPCSYKETECHATDLRLFTLLSIAAIFASATFLTSAKYYSDLIVFAPSVRPPLSPIHSLLFPIRLNRDKLILRYFDPEAGVLIVRQTGVRGWP